MSKRTTLAATLAIIAAATTYLLWPRREQPTYVPHAGGQTAVAGIVVDEAGQPLAGIPISWFAQVGDAGMVTAYAGANESVRSDADGRFEITGLEPGNGMLSIQSHLCRREGTSADIELRQGMVAGGLRLVAEVIPAARRLRGKLLLPDGAAAPGRSVQASYRSWLGSTWQGLATTDADGVFELTSPWPGLECELSLLDPGPPLPLAKAKLGTDGLELRVPAPR